MKFIINSQIFAKELQAMSGVLANNAQVPIISCFLFSLEGKTLTIRATDLENTLISTIELEEVEVVDGCAEVAVPAKTLLEMLRAMGDESITFAVEADSFAIHVISSAGKYDISGQNPETFPAMLPKGETSTIVMPASVLVNAISKTIFATCTDDMRPAMAGVYCEITPEGTTFVATDALRLVRYRRLDVTFDEPKSFIFAKKPLTIVKNILSSREEDCDVTVEFSQKDIYFSFENMFIACRLVDGKYPAYEAAIPKESPYHLTLDKNMFLNSLRRMMIFASQSTHQVRIKTNSTEIIITAEDPDFANSARERLKCEYDGEPMDIGFNGKYLIEMLQNIDSENVTMSMSHPSRAGLLTPIVDDENSKEDILMLVMPVMLANN